MPSSLVRLSKAKTVQHTVGAANPHFFEFAEAYVEVSFSLIFNLEGLDHDEFLLLGSILPCVNKAISGVFSTW